jgi:hypothetical protein
VEEAAPVRRQSMVWRQPAQHTVYAFLPNTSGVAALMDGE